jgi:hypothetical protein
MWNVCTPESYPSTVGNENTPVEANCRWWTKLVDVERGVVSELPITSKIARPSVLQFDGFHSACLYIPTAKWRWVIYRYPRRIMLTNQNRSMWWSRRGTASNPLNLSFLMSLCTRALLIVNRGLISVYHLLAYAWLSRLDRLTMGLYWLVSVAREFLPCSRPS